MLSSTEEFLRQLKPELKGKESDYQPRAEQYPSAYHTVIRCTYQNSDCVAKTVSHNISWTSLSGMPDFQKEMLYLQDLKHPNVIQLLAVINLESSNHLAAIFPYANEGALSNFFNKYAYADITWNTRLKLALDLTKGVEYLHSQGILHLDLRPPNVLITFQANNYHLIINDLGNARQRVRARIYQEEEDQTLERADPAFVAPELTHRQPIMSAKADILSLGIMLWTLSEHKYPIRDIFIGCCGITYDFTTQGFFGNRFRQATPAAYRLLVSDCWTQSPDKRPTASDTLNRLTNLAADENGERVKLV